jgi:MFS family permease
MLASAFGLASFMDASSPAIIMNILFALAGIGWATINVNSFPMVVEMCTGSNTGKYTGYYYTASMAAQIATPIVSGFLMDKIADTVLFPYAAAFAALALVTMLFVKHGDSKAPVKDSVLENLDVDG